MARLVNGNATRRLQVVRGPHGGAPARAGARAGACARVLRSCAAYLGHGLCVLGQHFSAGAWCADADDPPRDERKRGA